MRLVIDLNSIGIRLFTACGDAAIAAREFYKELRDHLDTFDLAPRDVVIVEDGKNSRKQRQRLLSTYKQHREKKPAEFYKELRELFKDIRLTMRDLGGLHVVADGYEADDVIYKIVQRVPSVVWTNDKDMLGLDTAVIYAGDIYTEYTPDRRFTRLRRTLVGDYGDFGSGSGAKGFGKKAWEKLVSTFGSDGLEILETLLEERRLREIEEDVDDMPELRRLLDSEDWLYKMWELTGPVDIKDSKIKVRAGLVKGSDCNTYERTFSEYYADVRLVDDSNELKEILRLSRGLDYISFDFETDVPEESHVWLANIDRNFDRPPIRVDVFASYITGCSVTVGKNLHRTFYIPIAHADTENIAIDDLKSLLTGFDCAMVAHNATGFELPVAYNNFGVWLNDVHCSAIAAKYVDENMSNSLKSLTGKLLGYKQMTYEEVTKGRGMSELTGEEVLKYGADDATVTAALMNYFEFMMMLEGTLDVYLNVERDAGYLTAKALVDGVSVDLSVLDKLRKADKAEADKAIEIINKYLMKVGWPGSRFIPFDEITPAAVKNAGRIVTGVPLKTLVRKPEKLAELIEHPDLKQCVLDWNVEALNQLCLEHFEPAVEFNIGSSKQKAELMYSEKYMDIPVRFYNKLTDRQRAFGLSKGNECTDESAIKWAIKDLGEDDERAKVLQAILRVMNFRTRDSLYYSSYKHLVHWKDGKLHPNLRQSATTTRRFAPSGPNVNQLPKRSEEGKKVRACVVPHHRDAVIIAPDISGQELRLGAWASQDENFLSCFLGEEKKDIHALTGIGICHELGKEFTDYNEFMVELDNGDKKAKEYRTTAKGVNFLSQYSDSDGGAYTLYKKLQIEEDMADKFLRAKDKMFPGVVEWKKRRGLFIRKHGYALTMLGAKRHLARLLRVSDNVGHVLRSGVNFEIQGSASEMTKMIMGRVWKSGILDRYDAMFYFPVHDELVFSVAKKDLEAFCRELYPLISAKYADMGIPVESELAVGPNFAEVASRPWPKAA